MGKKSKQDVLVPYDFLSIFETLVKQGKAQAAAELSIAIIRYDRDGTAPDFTDDGVGFVWESVVRPKLDEYKKAYEEVGEKRRAAVNSRYRNKSEQMNTNVDNSIQDKQMNTNVHDNHNHNHNHNLNNIIPSNIQTTSSNSSDINNNIYISNEPVDNSQQPVDNSETTQDENAQQSSGTVRPASLDGMDLYNLSSPEAFNLFRLEYPRHQGALRDVQAAWLTAIAGGVAPGDLVMAARKYARQVREEKTEQRYISMPQTFLRDRWRDYIPKYSPGCPHCHGQGVYETDAGMVMCDCDRRYG